MTPVAPELFRLRLRFVHTDRYKNFLDIAAERATVPLDRPIGTHTTPTHGMAYRGDTMLTPKVTELRRLSAHRREVAYVRASLLRGIAYESEARTSGKRS